MTAATNFSPSMSKTATTAKDSKNTKIPKKLDNFKNSAAAVVEYQKHLKEENKIMENYYNTKLALLKENLMLKKRKVKALESVANSMKNFF